MCSKTGHFYLSATPRREIVERGLEDVEDYYLAAEALRRVRSVRSAFIR